MNSKVQAIIRAGGICTFLGTTSLTAFFGWYKAVSVSSAEASQSNISFLPETREDSIALNEEDFQRALEQADNFEASRNMTFADNNTPLEIRLAPPLHKENTPAYDPFAISSEENANIEGDATLAENTQEQEDTDDKSDKNADPNLKVVALEQGSNLMNMFTEQGVSNDTFWKIYNAVKPIHSLNVIPAGKEFTLSWKDENGQRLLDSVHFSVDAKTTIRISRQEDGEFFASKMERPTVKQLLRAEAVINSSLYSAGNDVGIPQTTMANLLKVFSWDIDFARDVKEGDKLSVLYNCDFDKETGERLSCSDILYASMNLSGKTKSLYAYTHKDGKTKFYSEKGFAAKKQFMRTPINGARVSSRFGNRKHPTLGYSKMHSGVDFAAPTGTPIYAAADGVISQRGRYGAAGNMVVLKHGKYVTRYLHMSKFRSGQRVGQRITQGDVIGYVGTTGRSTGPHLHYEIRLASNNSALNPLKVTPEATSGLQNAEAKAFQSRRKELDRLYASSKPNYLPSPNEILTAIVDGSIDTRLASTAENKYVGQNEIPLTEVKIMPRPKDLSS